MGNRVGVGYALNDDGSEYRAFYVHWGSENLKQSVMDEFPDGMQFENYLEWVEEGIDGAGRSTVDSEPYWDGDPADDNAITRENFSNFDVNRILVLCPDLSWREHKLT